MKQISVALFDIRFNRILKDPKRSEDYKADETLIELRLLVVNVIITLKILFYTILTLYFAGTYWVGISLVLYTYQDYNDINDHFISSEMEQPVESKIIRSFYFALTTLSTVGFGDFYPISDIERILGSLFILFGVALFSIIISEFLGMIESIQNVMNQDTDDELLDTFFTLVK